MYDQFIVKGILIRVTDKHYVTEYDGGISLWSKRFYRLPLDV